MIKTACNIKEIDCIKYYPCLKIVKHRGLVEHRGLIVLFTEKSTGICIKLDKGSRYAIGEYRHDWIEDEFILFNDILTLQNV